MRSTAIPSASGPATPRVGILDVAAHDVGDVLEREANNRHERHPGEGQGEQQRYERDGVATVYPRCVSKQTRLAATKTTRHSAAGSSGTVAGGRTHPQPRRRRQQDRAGHRLCGTLARVQAAAVAVKSRRCAAGPRSSVSGTSPLVSAVSRADRIPRRRMADPVRGVRTNLA